MTQKKQTDTAAKTAKGPAAKKKTRDSECPCCGTGFEAARELHRSPEAWHSQLAAESPAPRPGQKTRLDWQHAAATTLHRWASFQHNNARPARMTREAYEAALDAVHGDSRGVVTPVKAAMGRCCSCCS